MGSATQIAWLCGKLNNVDWISRGRWRRGKIEQKDQKDQKKYSALIQ